MSKCRPSKWVPYVLAGVPLALLAAYGTTSGGLLSDVRDRAAQALSASETTAWAKVENDGRDLKLVGTAPSQEAVDAAVQAVAGTYGVRTVTNTVQIVEPVKMTAPTVESATVATATPEIKGTWHEGVATGLTVKLGDTAYKLPDSPELTTLAGNWTLKPSQPLAEGTYDITVESTDGKETLAAAAPGKLVVDLPDPVPEVELPRPTIEPYLGNNLTPTLKGTWPEVAAKEAGKNLQLKLNDNKFVLGENKELTTDGSGNWQFVPSTPLAEGELSAMPGIVGPDGKWLTAEAPAKVVIDVTPPPVAELTAVAPDVKWPFALTGKWLEDAGNKLAATFAGKTYALGADAALTSDGKGNFSLDPKVELAPGSYDLDVSVTDAAGNVAAQKLAAAVVIPEPVKIEPVKPAVIEPVAPGSRIVSGTWDERPGNGLEASVAGRSYVLGRGSALTSNGAGRFTFAPAAKFAPGSYDVDITTIDAKGDKQVVTAKAAIVVPEPVVVPEPAKPATLDAIAPDAKWPFPITGTWDERSGNSLEASVAGRSYVLGRGSALTSDGAGRFTFAPAAKFAPGSYDVDFTTTDAKGAQQVVTAKAAIVVPEPVVAPEPAKPATFDAIAPGAKWPYPITGTWDERPGNSLTASLAGRSYQLGRGAALTSDGTGRFTFAAQAKLPPGTYDVDFTTTDAAGTANVVTAKAAVVVPEPAPGPAPVVVEKIAVPAPTVTPMVDLTGAPLIKGAWPHTVADKFSVSVAGRTYKLGQDQQLSAKDGNWTLFPAAALKDGMYDVIAVASAGAGNLAFDETKNEIEVDAEQAAVPTVVAYSGDVSPTELTGTWDQAQAKGLKVTVVEANLSAELGAAASPLYSDGKGNWRLVLPTSLAAGTYEVKAESMDRHGRVQTDASSAEVVVVAKGQEPPAVVDYDCVGVMARIGSVFPIRFEFDRTDITKPFDMSVSQYAALLNDARCASVNVEIEGHADFRGTEVYNMDLSERRADVIRGMLEQAGVKPERMTIKGMGESMPLDPAETDEARMKNRRVQITAKP